MNLPLVLDAKDLDTNSINMNEFLSHKKNLNLSMKYTSVIISSEETLVSHEKITVILSHLESGSDVLIKYKGQAAIKASEALVEAKLSGLISIEAFETPEGLEIKGKSTDQKAVQRARRSKDAFKAVLTSEAPVNTKLVDDSALFTEEDLFKPVAASVEVIGEDCGPKSKKKACKNCSCGLKEIEDANEIKDEAKEDSKVIVDTTNVKSSCGSVNITRREQYFQYSFLSFLL